MVFKGKNMNDKRIRKILISYLKATNTEIRIYQEKSIGSSVCDVMAVTDILTGYEIKSDLDNYSRLDKQVKSYSYFFDRNYVVVSNRHLSSIGSKIPDNWGVLCIREDNITVERAAKTNMGVSRRKQLSILWKLELKNILIKNHMPIYAQKEKGYISDRIAEQIDSKTLGGQIAYELMHRDYSFYDARDYTEYYNEFKSDNGIPAEEIVDTLSENNLKSFTLDKWIELYKIAKDRQYKKEKVYNANVIDRSKLHKIKYNDIEASLGAPWIDKTIISDFIYHLLYNEEQKKYSSALCPYVSYEPVTGSWFIENKNTLGRGNTNIEFKFGIPRYNALYILEATLNLRQIKLYNAYNKYDEKDTLAALEKQKLIIQEFKEWIWLDEDRRWLVEEAYNNIFNNYEINHCDGSKLCFPDMNPDFSLFPYQKDAVQKIIDSKNTLLAFDVGAGKTYIMIAAAMKMRKEGLSRKNMFVVPNHIVGQWEKIFSQLYPQAKILMIEPKAFKPEMRKKVLNQIKEGDYDGIIIAYSCFELIPLSANSVLSNLDKSLKKIEDAVKHLRYNTGLYTGLKWGRKPLEDERKYIINLTNEFIKNMAPQISSDTTFEKLEINTLFVDEAHNFKNIPIRTKMKNLNGINTKGSRKCMDMLQKVRCVQAMNNGRGVVFATGTPLCNSISDAYAMQLYLQNEELEKNHLDVFDNWVKTFARAENVCEVDVDTSKYRFITKFVKFFNLPELSLMFSQIAVFYAVDDKENIPRFSGYKDEVIKKYKELSEYMITLCKRSEKIRLGKISRQEDNMLKVSTDGRKAALDLQLVGHKQPYDYSKTSRCVKNVVDLYYKYSGVTQLIFCDYSTPKGEDFSVYKVLREKLSESGIPKKEIVFIHNYKTESRKVELFRKFNNGEIRILIGSTFKLGIGANVQNRLKAIHHLDVPWRPADMVQREGRILRRGNENKDVLIYRYITEGSFDSYAWQILETKQRFISQFLSGSSYQRSIADLENNVLSYSEVKALALAEPLMKRLAEKENELKTLRIVATKDSETLEDLKKRKNELNTQIPIMKERILQAVQIAGQLKKYSDKVYKEEYKKIADVFSEDVVLNKQIPTVQVTVLIFRIEIPKEQDNKKPYIKLLYDNMQYNLQVGTSSSGNARRIINFLKGFEKVVVKEQKKLDKLINDKKVIEKALLLGNNKNNEKIRQIETEIVEIRSHIDTKFL